MNYYFVANIKIEDLEEYQKYIKEADEILAKYNGTYLALMIRPKHLKENGNIAEQ